MCALLPCTGNTNATTRHPAYVLYKSDRYPGGAPAASGGGGGGGAPQTTRRRPTLLPGQRSHTLLYAHTPIRPDEGFLPLIFPPLSHTPPPVMPATFTTMILLLLCVRERFLYTCAWRLYIYIGTMRAVYTAYIPVYAFWSDFLICKSTTRRKAAAGFHREPWENLGPAGRSTYNVITCYARKTRMFYVRAHRRLHSVHARF